MGDGDSPVLLVRSFWRRFPPGAGERGAASPTAAPSPSPGSKYGSWTCLGAAPGLAQRGTREDARGLGLHPHPGVEGTGARIGDPPPRPNVLSGPQGSKGVSDRLACPGSRSRQGPARPGNPRPRALAPCAGYLPSLCGCRGGARRASRVGARSALPAELTSFP